MRSGAVVSKPKSQKIKIETESGAVSGILDLPKAATAGMLLAHGAGAGMNHKFMATLAARLVTREIAVLRFQFPYMEAGRKRTDHPSVAVATVVAAAVELRQQLPRIPLFAAGKSFGARMTTTAASEGLLTDIKGIICYGFPLHPADQPSIKRAQHLASVPSRLLFLQGTRDKLAELDLIRGVCAKLPSADLHIVEGADHGFDVLKRSGRTAEDVLEELANESKRFVDSLLS